MQQTAPSTYKNSSALAWRTPSTNLSASDVLEYHKSLPTYAPTQLVSLPDGITSPLGLEPGSLYVKDESVRFGLPSFKIAGASWAIHNALCSKLGLDVKTPAPALSAAARKAGISLVTCSDGNWGRSVAHMAGQLQIRATVYVPDNIDAQTRANIESEGAECLVSEGNYDAAIESAKKKAAASGGLLVMDTSWEGFKAFPSWVTEGYETILQEVSKEIPDPTVVVVSVGVGSWAHAVIAHYKSAARAQGKDTIIVAVEATAAPSLNTALKNGQITTIETGDTICCGMNCGTTSLIAWPFLRDGVSASVVISDVEADAAVRDLHAAGVNAGPCGAAPLAALRKLVNEGDIAIDQDSKIVLFCSEGARPYSIPN